MAQEIHDLVVSVTPQGVGDTTDKLGDMSGEFEDTAESAGDSAGILEDFSEQMQGAAGVVAAGLGVAASALLAQVPVIQESLSGLSAILDVLIIRLDNRLRPALNRLTDAFFNVADKTGALDGAVGAIIDTLLVAATVFALINGLLAIYSAVAAGAAAVSAVLGLSLLPLLAIIALISVAIAALGIAWQENFLGIQDLVAAVVSAIQGDFAPLIEFFQNSLNAIIGLVAGFVGAFVNAWGRFTIHVVSAGRKLWAILRTGFEVIFDFIVAASKSFANIVHGVIIGLINGIINNINRGVRAIEHLINQAAEAASDVPGLNISRVNLGQIDRIENQPLFNPRSGQQIMSAAGRRVGRRDRQISREEQRAIGMLSSEITALVAALQNNPIQINTRLDGEQVARNQEQFLGGGASNQGRNNPLG